jgi:hypothetical protein
MPTAAVPLVSSLAEVLDVESWQPLQMHQQPLSGPDPLGSDSFNSITETVPSPNSVSSIVRRSAVTKAMFFSLRLRFI